MIKDDGCGASYPSHIHCGEPASISQECPECDAELLLREMCFTSRSCDDDYDEREAKVEHYCWDFNMKYNACLAEKCSDNMSTNSFDDDDIWDIRLIQRQYDDDDCEHSRRYEYDNSDKYIKLDSCIISSIEGGRKEKWTCNGNELMVTQYSDADCQTVDGNLLFYCRRCCSFLLFFFSSPPVTIYFYL